MMRELAKRALRAGQLAVPVPRGDTVVLAYHLIGANTGTEVDLALDLFRCHLDWLESECDVVALASVTTPCRASRMRVALTFDDAFANFAEVTWPELLRRQLPATLFVPTGFVDGVRPSPLSGANLEACSWEQLRAMQAQGLVIGSHTHTHINLRKISASAVECELALAKQRLRKELGRDSDDFCFPQAKWSKQTKTIVGRHHRRAVIGSGRHIFRDVDPLAIPRIPVRRSHEQLAPLLERGVWLEEWVADKIRQHR